MGPVVPNYSMSLSKCEDLTHFSFGSCEALRKLVTLIRIKSLAILYYKLNRVYYQKHLILINYSHQHC